MSGCQAQAVINGVAINCDQGYYSDHGETHTNREHALAWSGMVVHDGTQATPAPTLTCPGVRTTITYSSTAASGWGR